MISFKQWAALLIFYLFYLLGGALVFLYLESDSEFRNLQETHNLQKKLSINLYFIENEPVKEEIQSTIQQLESSIGKNLLLSSSFQEELLLRIVQAEELPTERPLALTNSSELLDEVVPQFNNESSSLTEKRDDLLAPHPLDVAVINGKVKWTIWNAFFFSFTVITTIGFGHMSPSTEAGQAFCIAYSLLGVPLNGIVFAGLADLFASKIIVRMEGGHYKKRRSMFFDACIYLIPGLCLLILLPAVMFMFLEDWSFLVSIYFAFITLTTIGFGDFVAGQRADAASLPWTWPYRICIMAWIILGLGYLLMVIAFIQRALRSKEVRRLDRTMRQTFKERISAMQNNVSRDIQRMRSVLDGIAKLRTSDKLTDGSNYNDGFEDDDYLKAGESAVDLQKRREKKSISVDMFLELAESILKQSETDLEDRVNDYNRTLTSLKELSIDENDNAFRANLFPARDSLVTKRPTTRRPSIWTSSSPPDLLRENESDIDRDEQGANELGQIIEKFHQMVESGGRNLHEDSLAVPDFDGQRRHSTAITFSNAAKKSREPERRQIDSAKRRQTVAELHMDNESVRL